MPVFPLFVEETTRNFLPPIFMIASFTRFIVDVIVIILLQSNSSGIFPFVIKDFTVIFIFLTFSPLPWGLGDYYLNNMKDVCKEVLSFFYSI